MKRKWHIAGLVPMLYSIARLAVSSLFFGLAWLVQNIVVLEVYETITWIIGPVILIAACVIMFSDFRKLLEDREALRSDPPYNAFKLSGYTLIKCLVDVLTAFVWELGTIDLDQKIDMLNGIPTAGHASGAAIYTSFGCAILQMSAALIISFVFDHKYAKKRQSLGSEQ